MYKGRLKENGDLVAVKVQRPFVLETVTVDLFVIRNLGLVLRKFPQVFFLNHKSHFLFLRDSFLKFVSENCIFADASLHIILILQVSIDVVGLVDEWAARFFEELDYVNEGENGTFFAEMMKKDLPQVGLIICKSFFFFNPTYAWIISSFAEFEVGCCQLHA